MLSAEDLLLNHEVVRIEGESRETASFQQHYIVQVRHVPDTKDVVQTHLSPTISVR